MSSETDSRQRSIEFDPNNKKSQTELIDILTKLEEDIRNIFAKVETVDLTQSQSVQCYVESNLSIIVHVIEHFSYHVGQITYITKMLLDIDTGYYAGLDLNKNT